VVTMRRAFLVALVVVPLVASACWGGDGERLGSEELGSAARDRVAMRSATSRNATVAADSLANTRIGGPYGTVLAFRFRSSWTGAVQGVRFYVVLNSDGRTGYSGGTGGTLRVALAADSGGRRLVPARRSLASATLDPPGRDGWPLVRFRTPARVVAGRTYHVVFTNLDPRPRRNYVSVNALVSHHNSDPAPRVHGGLEVLLSAAPDGGRTPGDWHTRVQRRGDRYVPIIEVVGDRPGQRLGVGYMEVWVNNPKPIGGGAMVRQLISPVAGKAVTGAWLRVRRREGTQAPLRLRFERAAGGVLAAGTVPAHEVPSDHPGWVHVRFPHAVSLEGTELFALTAAATARSAYEAFAIRKGTQFGFDPRTVFDGGYAQFTERGAWVGWDQWGGRDLRTGDLQFALDTVER
jgi:hypothetical protein